MERRENEMETSRCRAFITAAEEGSLTAAADKLGYTPSGVSQLVSALEDDIGLKLLERAKKGVTLTEEGERMLPVIRRFLGSESDVYEMASDIKGLNLGDVTLASFPSIATFWLPEVIGKFQTEYPGIRIRIMEGITQEIDEWLEEGTADLGFMAYIEPMLHDWIPLGEDRMVAVLSKDHPLAKRKSYPLTRCAEEDFIMPALGHDLDVEKLLKENDIVPNIKFTTMENPVLLSMINNGLGMSIMNELCTTLWKDKLAIMPLDPPESVTFGIASARGRHMSPAAEKFLEFAVKMLTGEEK